MSVHRITIDLWVDDEALAEHLPTAEQRGGPYTADLSEWDASDIFRAAEREIVLPGDSSIAWYDGLQPERQS